MSQTVGLGEYAGVYGIKCISLRGMYESTVCVLQSVCLFTCTYVRLYVCLFVRLYVCNSVGWCGPTCLEKFADCRPQIV